EPEVCRALGEPANQVRVPLRAVRDVDPYLVAGADQTQLLLRAYPVEHLELEVARRAAEPPGPVLGDRDQPGVVRGDHRVAAARHQDVQAAYEGSLHLHRGLEGHRLRLGVRALAQPYPRARGTQLTAVPLGAAQVGLEHRAGGREVRPQPGQRVQRLVGGLVVLHVEGDRGTGGRGRRADRVRVLV